MANWIPPQLADPNEHARSLSFTEYSVFYMGAFPWGGGLDELWSWRGHIARKLLGRMPTQEEVDVEADSAYWEPDRIFVSETRNHRGEVIATEYRRRGRRMKETNTALKRFKRLRARS